MNAPVPDRRLPHLTRRKRVLLSRSLGVVLLTSILLAVALVGPVRMMAAGTSYGAAQVAPIPGSMPGARFQSALPEEGTLNGPGSGATVPLPEHAPASGQNPAVVAVLVPITVNSTADVIDGNDGQCTLREAIIAANTDTASGPAAGECPAGSGADTIILPSGTYTLTIPGTGEDAAQTGDLDITADLTIQGAGASTTIVDGNGLDRVFHILAGTVTIADVTIRNGGSVSSGGGIFNSATLTLTDSAVISNTATSDGGGIKNQGSGATMALINTLVSGNSTASQDGGGIRNRLGTMTLTNTTVRDNEAGDDGGGIDHSGGVLTLIDSTVISNTAVADGGGIESIGTMTLTNTTVSGNVAGNVGGGIRNQGSSSTVTLTNVTVSGNAAGNAGGGIDNEGTLTATNTTVSDNTASNKGGGIFNESSATLALTNTSVISNTASNNISGEGGGIFNSRDASATLNNSTIRGNEARGAFVGGGGISNRGTLTLADSTVSDNLARSSGGGIKNGETGTLMVVRSTVSSNDAEFGGGVSNFGNVTLVNTTISGNTASNDGGGISNRTSATAVITNTTVSSNTAADNGGGIDNGTGGTVELKNTIVANSLNGGDCAGAPITDNGNNLDSDGTCGVGTTADPLLGPLQDNGGPTFTHALLAGSPAIDACDDAAAPATDQRGVARPQDGNGDGSAVCDIGAYEKVPLPPPVVRPVGGYGEVPGVWELLAPWLVLLGLMGMGLTRLLLHRTEGSR